MSSPPNCVAPRGQHEGAESISVCQRCYIGKWITMEEWNVVAAAIAVRMGHTPQIVLDVAVDTLVERVRGLAKLAKP